MNTQRGAGFTLIELLVVVLIIGILAAVALPQYTKAVEKSRAAQALSTLKSVGQAGDVAHFASGSYPTEFDEMDVALDWTGNTPWYTGATDTRSNGDWSLQIISEGSTSGIYMGRLSGEYQGGGFAWFTLNGYGLDNSKIYCLERLTTGVTFGKNQGDYCTKLFQASFVKKAGGVNVFKMP